MSSLNKVLLVGGIVADARIVEVGQYKKAQFAIATSEKFKDKTGKYREEVEFHNCELFGSEAMHQYLKKGTMVYIEGAIKTDKWVDKSGEKKEYKKIKVISLQFISSKRGGNDATEPENPVAVAADAPSAPTQDYFPPVGNRSFPASQRTDNDLPF